VARDQDGVELGAALGGDPDGVDDRHVLLREVAEQGVLVSREHARKLLQRVEARAERAFVLDEAHHVAVDPAYDLDQPRALPLLERPAPGEVEEVRVAGTRAQLHVRPGPSGRARARA
jgi:hypothetical protein